jgi:hypothetical protein
MFHEVWSAEVQNDRWLGRLWWGMHALVASAVGLCGVAMHWSSLLSLGLTLVAGLLSYRLGRRLPVAWFGQGYLVLSGQGAKWRDEAGRLIEGDVVWLWTGPQLVGLMLKHQQGHFPIWMTRRRVGETAWWQLQRWLRFEQAGSR